MASGSRLFVLVVGMLGAVVACDDGGRARAPGSTVVSSTPSDESADATADATSVASVETGNPPIEGWLPPPRGGYFDYQLGGDYPPAPEVMVLTRDWFAGSPADGLYNICYVNAFQTQPPDDAARPDEREGWPADVVLAVEDPQWPGEFVIDLSTAERRSAAAAHVVAMLDTCAEKGFDAVEFDNLDTYSRFTDLPFGEAETVEYAATITAAAHERRLAVGQKNTVELTAEQARGVIGFDFAVVEECAEFDECAAYRERYDLYVLAIEYSPEGMVEACEQFGGGVPVLRRDLGLVPPDDPAYQFETFCGFRGYG